jgi:hypothetical protein
MLRILHSSLLTRSAHASISEHGRRKKNKEKIRRMEAVEKRVERVVQPRWRRRVVWAGEEGRPQMRLHLVRPLELLLDRLKSYSAVCVPSPLPIDRRRDEMKHGLLKTRSSQAYVRKYSSTSKTKWKCIACSADCSCSDRTV